MRWLHLYRPQLPGTRAQSIQIVRTCHALASMGHDITLLADRGPGPDPLAGMGLDPIPGFHLKRAPVRHRGLAGLWFRRALHHWWRGPPGVVLARDKRRLLAAVAAHGRRDHRLILETHELDSDSSPEAHTQWLDVEKQCLSIADAVVANCGGTLDAWMEHHTLDAARATVVHNATHVAAAGEEPLDTAAHILVLGSMRLNKGVRFVLSNAGSLPCPLHWVGGTAAERSLAGDVDNVVLSPPVAHSQIQTQLSNASVLLLPLGDNSFSRRHTSPLKLWDYLATTRPIVAADTPAVAEIAAMANTPFFLYTPEDPQSLKDAVDAALRAPPRQPFQRRWSERAEELSSIAEALS